MKAIIYTTPTCEYCKMAKILMEKKGIDYQEFTVGKDITKKELMETLNKEIKTVPQILVDNQYIGGYTELSKFLR